MDHCATLTTPDNFAMKARRDRLKRLCRSTVRQHARELLEAKVARAERPKVNLEGVVLPLVLCAVPFYYIGAASSFLSQFN